MKTNVRRPMGSDRYDSRYTVKTVKHAESLMVWGSFSGAVGRGGLFFLPKNTTMNSERYQRTLEDHLLPFFQIHQCTHFLQDGAPCHASKKTKAFLAEQPFSVMDWPGNSLDLNPIENLWNIMKDGLKSKDIGSIPKLQAELKKLWVTLDQAMLRNLSDSMPRRLQMVLNAKGEMTKY